MRRSTGMLLLDIEKAFDSIWHNGLLYKSQQFRYPEYIIHTVKNFLQSRKCQVHLKDEYSSTREIHAGLLQGYVLLSILFSIFLSDFTISDSFQKAQFADKSAIIITAKSLNKIIKSLKKVHSSKIYFHKWKIKINELKTDIPIQ